MDRKALGWIAALAVMSSALACAPAVACPEVQVAESPRTSPHAAKPVVELKFDWPVRGRIVFECWTEDKERLTIAARNGAEVRAARSGLVLFAGEYKGYGGLALIRHDDGYVSAYYGDVGDFRVKAHDSVARGQAIAAMRAPDDEMAKLRFELRRDDVSIDPRPLMKTDEPPSDDGGDSLSAK